MYGSRKISSEGVHHIMNNTLDIPTHLKKLKQVLMHIRPERAQGFEGLISTMLSAIVGIPFRLATSGPQFGVDGTSAYSEPSISFECKRYDEGPVSPSEVSSKIGDLTTRDGDIDLWVLCATCSVSTQAAENVIRFGTTHAISTLILDWTENGIPPLAAALAMAIDPVVDFIRRVLPQQPSAEEATTALTAIANDPSFALQADRIRRTLSDPTLGMEAARAANDRWLRQTFSSEPEATLRLGQPLAPADPTNGTDYPRDDLISSVLPFLTGKPQGTTLYIIGAEGTGKSWLVAQSWLRASKKPLMVILSPNVFSESAEQDHPSSILITALTKQIDYFPHPTGELKWQRVLATWHAIVSDKVRCVVVVDGVNQRPERGWARRLEKLASELTEYGCQLVVTVRTSYFNLQIKPFFSRVHNSLSVPEWSDEDRSTILAQHAIPHADCNPRVAVMLRNPRILGITLRLWTAQEICALDELSVSRLLFEHIRTTFQPDGHTIHDSIQEIRSHAERILGRVTEKDIHDLIIFEDDLRSVAGERFFSILEDDPTRYRLNEEGLALALGLLVLDRVRYASRNGIPVTEALVHTVEPLSTLDMTAEVVVAAITVAFIDPLQTQETRVALVRVFADLQNPGQNSISELIRLATTRPSVFVEAARFLCLEGGGQPNFDLVERILIDAGKDEAAWRAMQSQVHLWLSCYPLKPLPHGLFDSTESVGSRDDTLSLAGKEFSTAVDQLSASESSLFLELEALEGDVDALSRLAVFLLAGHPRASSARILVRWCFAISLCQDYVRSLGEFTRLICLNPIDWSDTRSELLSESSVLREPGVSSAGQLALVRILQATGDPRDARDARALIRQLTGDRTQSTQIWRQIEEYCTSDPCDPRSPRPDNVGATSNRYSRIAFAKFHPEKTTREHMFFKMARPAMARFDVRVAADKHREIFEAILLSADATWDTRMSEISAHNSLLTSTHQNALRKKASCGSRNTTGFEYNRHWLKVQNSLLLVFPLVSAEAQIDLLTRTDLEPMTKLLPNLNPIDGATFASRLQTAYDSRRESALFALLLVASRTATQVTAPSRQFITKLLTTSTSRVRAQIYHLIAQLADRSLMSVFARTSWTASAATRFDESRYGARLLSRAAHRQLISYADALRRITPSDYGEASVLWRGRQVMRNIAKQIDVSVGRTLTLLDAVDPPALEIHVDYTDTLRPLISSSVDQLLASDHFFGTRNVSETLKENEERVRNYSERLRKEGCFVIIDHLDLDEFRSVVQAAPSLSNRWYELFSGLAKMERRAFHNLILLLGYALSDTDPSRTARLFRSVMNQEPMIPVLYGTARVPLAPLAMWSGPETVVLNQIRFRRLDDASNDYLLSIETLAAHLKGKQNLLRQYVESRLAKREPAATARAVMVVGFSDHSTFNDSILSDHKGTDGFVGVVCENASYAYDRNVWARHWLEKMCLATDVVGFWRYSVLFLKVVDGRYDAWFSGYRERNDPMRRFFPNLNDSLNNRVKKWRSRREYKLFGADRPKPAFLSSGGSASSGPETRDG